MIDESKQIPVAMAVYQCTVERERLEQLAMAASGDDAKRLWACASVALRLAEYISAYALNHTQKTKP